MAIRPLAFIICFFCCSCSRYYVAVYQQKIDATSLASSSIGTPDPRQKFPPLGQELVVEWQLPIDYLKENPLVRLEVIFWDNVERQYVWPINQRKGYRTLSILNEEYAKTGGVLAYRATVLNEEGQVFRQWRHMLWVNLIRPQEVTPQETSTLDFIQHQDIQSLK